MARGDVDVSRGCLGNAVRLTVSSLSTGVDAIGMSFLSPYWWVGGGFDLVTYRDYNNSLKYEFLPDGRDPVTSSFSTTGFLPVHLHIVALARALDAVPQGIPLCGDFAALKLTATPINCLNLDGQGSSLTYAFSVRGSLTYAHMLFAFPVGIEAGFEHMRVFRAEHVQLGSYGSATLPQRDFDRLYVGVHIGVQVLSLARQALGRRFAPPPFLRREGVMWDEAVATATQESYERYLRVYPTGGIPGT
jgi:hypothetical protein